MYHMLHWPYIYIKLWDKLWLLCDSAIKYIRKEQFLIMGLVNLVTLIFISETFKVCKS